MNGSNYVLPLTQGAPSAVRVAASGVVGVLLAAVPVLLGSKAHRSAHPGDPGWVPRLAQAGVLLGAVAVALRLVATVLATVQVTRSGFFVPL
jgi:hypothetical protein